MRSIHKGSIAFGLVNVPVKFYGATEEHDQKCHQVHNADGGRIRYKRVCEDCGEPVEYGDIVKGYEHGDGIVVLTEDDLATLPSEQNHNIDVLEFVPAGAIDPLFYEKAYFVGPDKSDKAYSLLVDTLAHIDRIALVQFAMRGKTRLAALRVLPKEHVLVAHTLRWPDEIRHASEIKVKEVQTKPIELELAQRLVESMANEWNADRYVDTYQTELQELIAAKASGQALPEVEKVSTEEVDDLLAALEASVRGRK